MALTQVGMMLRLSGFSCPAAESGRGNPPIAAGSSPAPRPAALHLRALREGATCSWSGSSTASAATSPIPGLVSCNPIGGPRGGSRRRPVMACGSSDWEPSVFETRASRSVQRDDGRTAAERPVRWPPQSRPVLPPAAPAHGGRAPDRAARGAPVWLRARQRVRSRRTGRRGYGGGSRTRARAWRSRASVIRSPPLPRRRRGRRTPWEQLLVGARARERLRAGSRSSSTAGRGRTAPRAGRTRPTRRRADSAPRGSR